MPVLGISCSWINSLKLVCSLLLSHWLSNFALVGKNLVTTKKTVTTLEESKFFFTVLCSFGETVQPLFSWHKIKNREAYNGLDFEKTFAVKEEHVQTNMRGCFACLPPEGDASPENTRGSL